MRERIDSAFYSLSCWQLSILSKSLRGNMKNMEFFFGHTIFIHYIYTHKQSNGGTIVRSLARSQLVHKMWKSSIHQILF